MNELLAEIYHCFYSPKESEALLQEVNTCHRSLIEALNKADRKMLLRIIDIKDQLAETQSLDSFICGFQLAWHMAVELSLYAAEHPVNTMPAIWDSKKGEESH